MHYKGYYISEIVLHLLLRRAIQKGECDSSCQMEQKDASETAKGSDPLHSW